MILMINTVYLSNLGETYQKAVVLEMCLIIQTIEKFNNLWWSTTDAAEKIYINIRETLGYTGKNYAKRRDNSTIILKITLREAAASNLQVLIQGQGMNECIYQNGQGGNLLKFYEYKSIRRRNLENLRQ